MIITFVLRQLLPPMILFLPLLDRLRLSVSQQYSGRARIVSPLFRIVEAQDISLGRFPSTHLTKYHLSILVETVGVEPTVPEAADLQSTGVTNFPTSPKLDAACWIRTNARRPQLSG